MAITPAESMQGVYWRRRARSVCTRCQTPVTTHVMCFRCRIADAERTARYRRNFGTRLEVKDGQTDD